MAKRPPGSAVAVSVIVPVRNRRDMLTDLLVSLDKQTYRDFEVIVIDDGSTDGSGEVAQSSVVAGRPVSVVSGSAGGAVAARRLGVEASKGSILAFTDSDCIVDPTWLEHAVAAMTDGADVVNGKTKPLRPLKPLERSVASGTEGLYPTCNVFYRRTLYDGLGGFDVAAARRWRFRPTTHARGLGFGEDSLLGWQAIRAGADVRFVPEAVVEHQVFPPDFKEVASRVAQTAAFPAMIREIPELRQTLMWHRILLGDKSRLPVYAMVAALVLRKRGLRAAVLAWWVVSLLRDSAYPVTERIPWLPAEMAVDAATTGALVIGSIRAGSAVL